MVQIPKVHLPNGIVLSWGGGGIPSSKWQGKWATEIYPLIQQIIFCMPDMFQVFFLTLGIQKWTREPSSLNSWSSDGYYFPTLFCQIFLLSPQFSQLDDPGWVSAFHWVFSLDQFATAGTDSVICNVFSMIPHPLDLLVSPGGQKLWPVHLWTSGPSQCPPPKQCSISNELQKSFSLSEEDALQKWASSSLPALLSRTTKDNNPLPRRCGGGSSVGSGLHWSVFAVH